MDVCAIKTVTETNYNLDEVPDVRFDNLCSQCIFTTLSEYSNIDFYITISADCPFMQPFMGAAPN